MSVGWLIRLIPRLLRFWVLLLNEESEEDRMKEAKIFFEINEEQILLKKEGKKCRKMENEIWQQDWCLF